MSTKKVKIDAWLIPQGQLDFVSVEILIEKLRECLEKGDRFIVVDAKHVYPILLESFVAMRNFVLYEAVHYSPFQIKCIHFNYLALLSLPLLEYPIEGDKLIFDMPSYGEIYLTGKNTVKCVGCGAFLYVQKAASHICPHCGFQMRLEF